MINGVPVSNTNLLKYQNELRGKFKDLFSIETQTSLRNEFKQVFGQKAKSTEAELRR